MMNAIERYQIERNFKFLLQSAVTSDVGTTSKQKNRCCEKVNCFSNKSFITVVHVLLPLFPLTYSVYPNFKNQNKKMTKGNNASSTLTELF